MIRAHVTSKPSEYIAEQRAWEVQVETTGKPQILPLLPYDGHGARFEGLGQWLQGALDSRFTSHTLPNVVTTTTLYKISRVRVFGQCRTTRYCRSKHTRDIHANAHLQMAEASTRDRASESGEVGQTELRNREGRRGVRVIDRHQ